jgi:plastocyanin
MEGRAPETEDRGMDAPEPERPMFDEADEEGFGWRRVMVWGAVAIIAVAVIRIALERVIHPFVLIPAAVFILGLLLLALVPRVGTVYLAIFAVAVGLFSFVAGPEGRFSLEHPEAPADFLPTLLALVGVVLILLASVPSFRQGKGSSRRSPGAVWVSVLTVLLLLGASGWSFAESRGVTSQAAAANDVLVVADDFEFVPTKVTAKAGVVSVHVDNADTTAHTFTIDDLDADVFVAGKTSQRVEFSAGPGEYVFRCIPHPWMEGILTVEE